MRTWITIILIIKILNLQAQPYAVPKGARAAGLGYAAVTLQDVWALGNNIGALAGIEKPVVGFAYYNPFLISGLQTVSLFAAAPLRPNTAWGAGIQHTGEATFGETHLSVGISQKMGITSLGLKINYIQVYFEGLGTRHLWVAEFGGLAQLSKKLWIGAHLLNLNQAQMAEYRNEKYPIVMKAGLSYRPTDKLMVNLETEKDIDYQTVVRGGLEYYFLKNMAFRVGVRSFPFTQSMGGRFRLYQWEIDYALQTHPQLPLSQSLSLHYTFEKRKKP